MATAPGYTVPRAVIEAFIRQSAQERGIDPNVAMEVYRREGAGGWQSGVVKNGQRETSYGPYQLYTGGGLGNKFQKDTGLDPRDPNTWQQNVTFALDEAKKGGWGPWYGAKAAGITGFDGIGGPATMPGSSPILPPTFTPPPTTPQPQPTMTAQAPAGAPMPLTPQQGNPLGSMMQLAKMFGSFGGGGGSAPQAAQAPMPQAPPPMPNPVALQALAQMMSSPSYENAASGRRFYS